MGFDIAVFGGLQMNCRSKTGVGTSANQNKEKEKRRNKEEIYLV